MKNEIDKLDEEAEDFIVTEGGTIIRKVDACIISYVDCNSKETEVVTLTPGQEFVYGDWDGSRCIRKRYKCE